THRREHHLLARPDINKPSPHHGMKQRAKTTSKSIDEMREVLVKVLTFGRRNARPRLTGFSA
ncbi:hypothetical protein ABZ478_20260, partial [Streptomyces sp. NPDC005706]